jgi:ribonucleoside-triphosphate reductase
MYKVVKRDGSIVDFNIHKISKAIEQAFDSVDVNSDADVIDFLSLKVTADFQAKVEDEKISVEDIQDSVNAYYLNLDIVMLQNPIFYIESFMRSKEA